jgi:hypothetical protein
MEGKRYHIMAETVCGLGGGTTSMSDEERIVVEKLRRLPSVSEKCCRGLYLLGIREIDDLKDKDPDQLYEALTLRKDFYAEPCMQKMIKIAVGMAKKGVLR